MQDVFSLTAANPIILLVAIYLLVGAAVWLSVFWFDIGRGRELDRSFGRAALTAIFWPFYVVGAMFALCVSMPVYP